MHAAMKMCLRLQVGPIELYLLQKKAIQHNASGWEIEKAHFKLKNLHGQPLVIAWRFCSVPPPAVNYYPECTCTAEG